MRVVSDGSSVSPVRRPNRDRDWVEIARQREVILELEGIVKTMLRLRRTLVSVRDHLDEGRYERARQEVGLVLDQWPLT
jgi:hypothetical protein